MFLNLQRTGTPPRPLPRSSALPLPRSSALPLPRSSPLNLPRSSALPLPPPFPRSPLSYHCLSRISSHLELVIYQRIYSTSFLEVLLQDDISKLSSVEVVPENLNASQAVKRYSSILEEVFICVLKSDEWFSPPSTETEMVQSSFEFLEFLPLTWSQLAALGGVSGNEAVSGSVAA